MPRDRMFRVLVLGGVALVGGSACGGSTIVSVHAGDSSTGSRVPAHPVASGEADLDAGAAAETNTGPPEDTGALNGATSEAGPDASDAACPPSETMVGTQCVYFFPAEAP